MTSRLAGILSLSASKRWLLAFSIGAIGAVGLARDACALTDSEKDALTLLVLGPKPNVVQTCTSAALELNVGLAIDHQAKLGDDEISRRLLAGPEGDAQRREFRELLVRDWLAKHSPPRVATLSLIHCLRRANVEIDLRPVAATCMHFAGAAALAEVQKQSGLSVDDAVSRVQALVGAWASADFVSTVTQEVYASDRTKDDYLVHRRVFAHCLRHVEPPASRPAAASTPASGAIEGGR